MNSPFCIGSCRVVAPFLAVLVAGLVTGCGGGGSTPDPATSGPAIVDNSLSRSDFRDSKNNAYYDIFVCDVRTSGTASIEMRSLEVDAYVYVYRKNSEGDFDLVGENDDISVENSDARLEFEVSRGKSYRILATSSGEDERGEYSLYFSENLGRPARVLPDANRTAPGIALQHSAPKLVRPKKAPQ